MAAVTLTDVARLAGVSQPTASRVLNGSVRKPAPQVIAAVHAAAQELGYIPNAQAQALARSVTGLVGLVVHDIVDPYFSSIAAGVQQATMDSGRQLILSTTMHRPPQQLAAVQAFIAHRVDAIVLVGSRWRTERADRMRGYLTRYVRNGGRVAVVGQTFPGTNAVVPRNRAGAAALAHALVEAGHKSFVVLSGPPALITAADRTAGFVGVLNKCGLRPATSIAGDFTRDGGYEAGTQAASEIIRFGQHTCVFAVNDAMALGAMAALRDHGIRVPEDVSVAGFDDIPTLRDHSPGLTTVALPLQEMGGRALQIAMTTPPDNPRVERVTGSIVIRDSTRLAPPATEPRQRPGR